MNESLPVRWFVIFIKPEPNGGGDVDTPDFPDLEFWHADKESARQEAERVMRELHEQGDDRNWKAVGHPDPLEVARGNHDVDQWIVSSEDVISGTRTR